MDEVTGMIGTTIEGNTAPELIDAIKAAEAAGVSSVWHWTAGAGLDALTLFAAAAPQTSRITMVASIVPTWPRHPIVTAQQAQVIEGIAPGRLRIGLGTGNKNGMTRLVGANWRTPQTNIREYATILKSLLQTGEADLDGEHWTAHAKTGNPMNVPVLTAALLASSYRVAGAASDGAISWLTPRSYIDAQCEPALREAAEKAGRDNVPGIAFHAPICLTEDASKAREAFRNYLGFYAGLNTYNAMYEAAGFSNPNGKYADETIDALLIYGTREQIAQRLREQVRGLVTDVVANPVYLTGDASEQQAAYEVVAAAGQ